MAFMRAVLGSLLFSAACSAASADQPVTPSRLPAPLLALANAPAKIRAPYDVQVVRDGGELLPTYAMGNRFYVQGNMGERYIIRVSNPTANRVEAVVTVDGLDVIDGEAGDLGKRGYIVPAYGSTDIEGYRTSTDDVATFRFSSVDGSYAGKQGKARNVGVIAVAVFEERPQPVEQQIVEPSPAKKRPSSDEIGGRKYDYERDLDAPSRGAPAGAAHGSASGGVPAPASPPRPQMSRERGGDDKDEAPRDGAAKTARLGLGTEYGEQRYSSVSFTRFVRAAARPIAVAELRYNDAAGLTALGINVAPMPDQRELIQRETADPFPGDHYAMPPR